MCVCLPLVYCTTWAGYTVSENSQGSTEVFWKAIASLLLCYGDRQNCGPGRDWFEFNMEVLKL